MSRRCSVMVLVFLAAHVGLAPAGGLIFRLPEDGSWATYEGVLSRRADAGGLAPKVDSTLKTTVYIASVGEVTIDKQRCRWLEIRFDLSVPVGDPTLKEKPTYRLLQRQTFKILIPEQYLVPDESPLDHFVRAWVRFDDSEAWVVTRRKELDETALAALLDERWRETDFKHIEKTDVESKLGKVACEGLEATAVAPDDPSKKGRVRVRVHPRSPFGVVTADWAFDGPGGAVTWSLKLVDFGQNATTKIPEGR